MDTILTTWVTMKHSRKQSHNQSKRPMECSLIDINNIFIDPPGTVFFKHSSQQNVPTAPYFESSYELFS